MNIKTSIRVAQATPQINEQLGLFVDSEHDIAWLEELDKDINMTGRPYEVLLDKSTPLRTSSIDQLVKEDSRQSAQLKKAYLKLALNSSSLVATVFPKAMQQPIQGMELLVASYSAYDAWTDPNKSNYVDAAFASGKTITEAIDVFAPLFPSLNTIKPYSDVAGVILKTAESVYLVYQSHQKSPL